MQMKKQAYFTTGNINVVGHELLTTVKKLRDKHTYKFVPQNSALLVIDMQNFFLQKEAKTFIPSMPAIIKPIQVIQNYYLDKNLLVIQTKHVDSNDKLMIQWWQSAIARDDLQNDIILDLANNKSQKLEKSQYDAFLYTNLENMLKENNIKQLVIVGVMANLCCETTARSAFMRGFEVFFVVDATAANNMAFHAASLLNLSYGFAIPVLVDEILGWLNEKK